MNRQGIAADAINLVKNAGLKKDVIDLFEKKIALLTGEIDVLSRNLEVSETERTKLQAKVTQLEQELERLRPKQDLEDDTIKVLRLFFDRDFTLSRIAQSVGLSEGMADYHCGVLQGRGSIALPSIMAFGVEPQLYITQRGREYVVKRGLV
jgi:hypothetical protein